MKNFMMAFSIEMHEIIISDLQDGVFFSKLICSDSNNTIEIDSRTSDAIALAVRFGCPIYTYEKILNDAGIIMGDRMEQPSHLDEKENVVANDLKKLTTADLNKLLNEVLEKEDYMTAIAIRDEINSRKKNK
jgi:bifunctional DNase/RNase